MLTYCIYAAFRIENQPILAQASEIIDPLLYYSIIMLPIEG